MFKWLLIILVAFITAWICAKPYVPTSITRSNFGKVMDSGLFSLEYKLRKNPENQKRSGVLHMSDAKVRRMIDAIEARGNPAVIYFYDTHGFFGKYVLNDINELAKKYVGKNVFFLIVAFEDDRQRVNYFLNKADKIYFKPIMVKRAYLADVGNNIRRNKEKINYLPALMVKTQGVADFENITPDFGSAERVEEIITKGK